MAVRPEVMGMFGGFRPSRQACGLVEKALSLEIDPSSHVAEATALTTINGRRKVHVQPGGPLDQLKGLVSMTEARRRMGRR